MNYIFKHGKSLNCKQDTHIRLVPLTIGLKWIEDVNDRIEVYGGVAPKYYFMHIKNESSFVPDSSKKHGCGAYITAGAFFYPVGSLMINLFVSYSYMNFSAPCCTPDFTAFSTNVSGIDIGAGLGCDF
jgi:outer membrane protein